MGGITLKSEEALYTNESRSNNKPSTKREYKNGDNERIHQGTAQPWRAQKNDNKNSQRKRFEGIYCNCRKKGHISKDCWSRKKVVESNMTTSKKEMDNEWDVELLCGIEEDELWR